MLKVVYSKTDKTKFAEGIRKGLLIDLDYALDLELHEKINMELLALFDAEELDFITNEDALTVQRHRTVKFFQY